MKADRCPRQNFPVWDPDVFEHALKRFQISGLTASTLSGLNTATSSASASRPTPKRSPELRCTPADWAARRLRPRLGASSPERSEPFNSLRVRLPARTDLIERLRLTAGTAAYVRCNGRRRRDHLLRQLLLSESAKHGNGVMLEASLDYYLTPLGASASAHATGLEHQHRQRDLDFLTAPQLSETGASPPNATACSRSRPIAGAIRRRLRTGTRSSPKQPSWLSAPMNWTGFYVGGHLGGGWSDAQWSDPFGSTVGPGGFVNVAGFGDMHPCHRAARRRSDRRRLANGALVLGVEADADAANMRGENTCFSGLGGINCQHAIIALGTITGRCRLRLGPLARLCEGWRRLD